MTFEERPTFLISSPQCSDLCEHRDADCAFQVGWSINPHMQVGSVDPAAAVTQHRRFVSALREAGAEIVEIPFLHGGFDSVFIKDNAVLFSSDGVRVALLALPSTQERLPEQASRRKALEAQGFEVFAEATEPLEGGDVIFLQGRRKVFYGYGQRSSKNAIPQLRDLAGCEVVGLELVDPFFFHLDTALSFLKVNGRHVAFAYPGAFSKESWERLICDLDVTAVVEVEREEALAFGLNWVEVNGTVIIGSEPPRVVQQLRAIGKKVVITPLDQFQLAGGSAACLATEIHVSDSILADPATLLREHIQTLVHLDS